MLKKVSYKVNRASGGARMKRDSKSKVADLDITSLVDILTILLLFLIQNISVVAQKNTIVQGITPPSTISTEELNENGQTVVIIFKQNRIAVGGGKVGGITFQELFSKSAEASAKKDGMYNFLKIEAGRIAKRETNNLPLMLIQADHKVPCKYITEFIKWSASSGFANIYFATTEASPTIYDLGGV